jgi:outer membrane immunogenic protein
MCLGAFTLLQSPVRFFLLVDSGVGRPLSDLQNSKARKLLLLASVSPVAALGFSSQADAQTPITSTAMPVHSWTGCYAGLNIGYGWGRQSPYMAGSKPFGFGCSAGSITGAASGHLESSGGLLGGQASCDLQFAPEWVVGIEGAIDEADIHGSGTDPFDVFTGNGSLSMTTDWIASITGRVGVTAWNNAVLFYVDGGFAWDRNNWNLSNTTLTFDSGSMIENRYGWTMGGGVEWALSPVWSVFAEYEYFDFGGGNSIISSSGNEFSSGKQTIEIVKIGFNFKWGTPPPP